jgi:hypothetical protein
MRRMAYNSTITVGSGHLVRCQHRPQRGLPECGQRVYETGIAPMISAVVPVTLQEWAEIAAAGEAPIDVLRRLGVLVEPEMRGVEKVA